MGDSYFSRKKKRKHIFREERDDLHRYLRESLKYQEWTFYCAFFLCLLAAILFLRMLFTAIFSF